MSDNPQPDSQAAASTPPAPPSTNPWDYVSPDDADRSAPLPPFTALNQLDIKAWNGFFRLAGGSLFYCLSALSIIYGIARILGPQLATTSTLSDAYPCLGALNLYEVALLGVLLFVVVREKVKDDAISLIILVALFLGGSGLTLSVVADSGVNIALLIGTASFLLGMGKLYVLKRYIGISLTVPLLGGLAAILAWTFGAGAALASLAEQAQVERTDWLLGSLLLIAGATAIFLGSELAHSKSSAVPPADAAFLNSSALPLLFTLILLVIAGIQQYTLGYVFDLPSRDGDFLPLITVASLIALRFSITVRHRTALLEAGIASVPLAAAAYATLSKNILAGPSVSPEALWYPPVLLAITGAAILWMALRRQSPALFAISACYLLAVILTFGYAPGNPTDLNWYTTGALAVAGLLGIGLLKRTIGLCFLAVIITTIGLASMNSFQQVAANWQLTAPGAVVGIAGFGTLLVALFFGRDTPRPAIVLGSLGVTLLTFDLMPAQPAPIDILTCGALLVLCAALWLRLRHWPSLVILLLPICHRLWLVFTTLKAWRYVILSFVLLFVGAWFSARKGRRTQPHNGPPTDSH